MEQIGHDPIVEGGHRVVFLASDDEDAIAPVADLAKQLGFAPVKLGKLNEGDGWYTHEDAPGGSSYFRMCLRSSSNRFAIV